MYYGNSTIGYAYSASTPYTNKPQAGGWYDGAGRYHSN